MRSVCTIRNNLHVAAQRSRAVISLVDSFTHLSPLIPSTYAVMEASGQNRERLTAQFVTQLPGDEAQECELDGTQWSHPAARSLEDYNTPATELSSCKTPPSVIGHPRLVLARIPEFHDN